MVLVVLGHAAPVRQVPDTLTGPRSVVDLGRPADVLNPERAGIGHQPVGQPGAVGRAGRADIDGTSHGGVVAGVGRGAEPGGVAEEPHGGLHIGVPRGQRGLPPRHPRRLRGQVSPVDELRRDPGGRYRVRMLSVRRRAGRRVRVRQRVGDVVAAWVGAGTGPAVAGVPGVPDPGDPLVAPPPPGGCGNVVHPAATAAVNAQVRTAAPARRTVHRARGGPGLRRAGANFEGMRTLLCGSLTPAGPGRACHPHASCKCSVHRSARTANAGRQSSDRVNPVRRPTHGSSARTGSRRSARHRAGASRSRAPCSGGGPRPASVAPGRSRSGRGRRDEAGILAGRGCGARRRSGIGRCAGRPPGVGVVPESDGVVDLAEVAQVGTWVRAVPLPAPTRARAAFSPGVSGRRASARRSRPAASSSVPRPHSLGRAPDAPDPDPLGTPGGPSRLR